MAIAVVQVPTIVIVSAGTSASKAYASNVTAGNCLLALTGQYDGTPPGGGPTINTPTDTRLNVYVPAYAYHVMPSNTQATQGFFTPYTSGGACTVTFSSGSGTGSITGICAEFSGLKTVVGVLDQTGRGAGTGTAVSATSNATTKRNELIVGAMAYESTDTTITEAQTLLGENENVSTSMPLSGTYQIVSTPGAKTNSWTLGASRDWVADVFTLAEQDSKIPPINKLRPRIFAPGIAR